MKQVILVRKDLKMPKGKLAVQAAHASVDAVLKTSKDKIDEWKSEGMKKVVLEVETLKELKDFQRQAKEAKLISSLITDAGLTVLTSGTVTCLAIGPDDENKIDKLTGKLKLV